MRYKAETVLKRQELEYYGFESAIKQAKRIMVSRGMEKFVDEDTSIANFDIRFREGWQMSDFGLTNYYVELEMNVIK